MANKKSKVKSYARRTKSGISRVTGHNRDNKNRNRNIAIGLGIGTSVLALGLGAKHLAKKKGLKTNVPQAQSVSFKPSPSPSPKPTVKPETPSATVAEVRQTTQAVVDKAKEIKADKPLSNSSPPPKAPTDLREATRAARQDAAQQAKVTIVDESKAKLNKRTDSTLKVMERRNLLMQVEFPNNVFKGSSAMRPYFGANAKMNPNRQLRKKAGKRLADAARDLKSRGMYPDNPKPKSKKKTNKLLDQALTGQGYQPKPKPKTTVVD